MRRFAAPWEYTPDPEAGDARREFVPERNKIRVITVSFPMKCLCYLFSFYFLMLSALPCTDTCASEGEVAGHQERIVSGEHAGCGHDQRDDLCSPFCTCSCCGQAIPGARDSQHWAKSTVVARKTAFPYRLSTQNAFNDGIFHPPKVVVC